MIELEKNRKKQKKPKSKFQGERKKAYRASIPFRTVEGIGTPPWDKLSPYSVWVHIEFYNKFNGYNRYNLSLTYKEVQDKMSSLIFSRSIWQLIGFGFIDVRRFGRLERNCSLFGLSNRWRKLSEEPEKLEQIEQLLNRIEYLKRQPGSQKKRMNMYELRKKILKI